MSTKNATSRTVTTSGELYEGGQNTMIIKGDFITTLADIVNSELYAFDKKNVKVNLKIEIEEID